jgi:hypothetical protein
MKKNDRSRITAAAHLVLAGGGLLSLIALVYFFYHYGLIGDRHFASAIGPIVYYALPAVVSLLLFSSLLLQPTVKEKLALLLFSTALCLVCAEFVLEALKPKQTTLWTPSTKQDIDKLVRLARQFGVEYDTRTQLQVVRDLRLKGVNAVPAVYPLGFFARQPDGTLKSQITIHNVEVLPLSGSSKRLTVFCNEAGQWITYQSDEHGFHNPSGIWSSEVIDIAVLGDSYAQGACVPSDRNFVAVIRARYPATLNLGNSNKGSLMSLADLKEYAAAFKPKVVLWFFYEGNDFRELKRESKSPLLMRYQNRHFNQDLLHLRGDLDRALEHRWVSSLKQVQTRWPDEDPTIIPIIPAVLRFSNLRRGLGLMGLGLMQRPVDRQSEVEQVITLLAEILLEAKVTVDSWGGRLYLVYLPQRERYTEPGTASLDEKRRVLSVARSYGVEVIDVHAAFQSTGDPLGLFPFRRRGHYNKEGHRLVAETVLQSLSLPGEDLR